jgi:hypothetical protein
VLLIEDIGLRFKPCFTEFFTNIGWSTYERIQIFIYRTQVKKLIHANNLTSTCGTCACPFVAFIIDRNSCLSCCRSACLLRNKNHVEIAVEIDPLEALVENSTTRTRLSKTEFWNGPDRKSPYLIVVLISCTNVAIDTL